MQADALAEALVARAAQLQTVDDARAHWLAHTAGTRAAAERAKAELSARHVDDTEPEQQVTAEEWLDAHRAALAEDDAHRSIGETDLAPIVDEPTRDEDTDAAADSPAAQLEAPDRDLRDLAADEPAPVAEDTVRVPSAQETSDAIERANRALIEMQAREVTDAAEAAEHRSGELNRWHSDDQAAEITDVDDDAREIGPAVDEPADAR